jgi:hypothetical protein
LLAALGVVTTVVVTVSMFESARMTAGPQQTAVSRVSEDLRVVPVQIAVVVRQTNNASEQPCREVCKQAASSHHSSIAIEEVTILLQTWSGLHAERKC